MDDATKTKINLFLRLDTRVTGSQLSDSIDLQTEYTLIHSFDYLQKKSAFFVFSNTDHSCLIS